MMGFSVAHGPAVINVRAPGDWRTLWSPLLEPYFSLGAIAPNAGATIEVSTTPVELGKPGAGRSVQAHMGKSATVYPGDGHSFSAELDQGKCRIQVVAEPRLHIRYFRDSEEAPLDALRLVRGLVIREACNDRRLPCHASALTIGGRGIAFTGASGSGKTSYLAATLKGVPAARMITNDKGIYNCDDGTLHGLPFAITIEPRTLAALGGIAYAPDDRMYGGEWLMWPASFSRRLGREVSVSARIEVLVLVQIDFAEPLLVITDCPPESASGLMSSFLTPSDSVSWSWIHDLLDGAEAKRPIAATNIGDVRQLRVRGNPFYRDNARKLVSAILGDMGEQ